MKLSPNKKPFHFSLGARGEILACNFLKQNGYEILEKNYRCPRGEIDAVARKGKKLIFVEVKARSSDQFGLPQEAVNKTKQEKLIKLARWYLKKEKKDFSISFGVIAILFEKERPQIEFIENAFEVEEDF